VLKKVIFVSVFGELFKITESSGRYSRSRCVRPVLFMGRAAEMRVSGIERDKPEKGIKMIYKHFAAPLVT
jgi:hypothetical protein